MYVSLSLQAKSLQSELNKEYQSCFGRYQAMTAKNNVREAIVSYAIEKALLEYGESALEEVYYKMYREHGLHLVDCYHNADLFRRVLLETFGDGYCKIVDLIRKHLGNYADQLQVGKFLSALE